MPKVDYKKDYKELYQPKTSPEVIDVPQMVFISLEGIGNPNGERFQQSVQALYAMSYAVKMSYKSSEIPPAYYDYTVFPLEGVWDLVDKTKPISDKDNYKYKLMIRQPEFLNEELFERFFQEVKRKKKLEMIEHVQLERYTEGLCVQMLHKGSYDDEPASFHVMEKYCTENNYARICKTHREIYLSDPRKSTVEKMRTVLRFKIEKEKDVKK